MKKKSANHPEQMQRPSILDCLASGKILISDGATGTYLQSHGLEPGGCPEEFNASHPDIVRKMAADYFEAGSDMVLTNSFGGNSFMLKKYGYGENCREFNKLAAQHARSAAGETHYVVGSVGPTGEFLEPLGDVTEAAMYEAFVEQITALEEGGADAVVIETMTALEESTLAIKAAKENTKLTVIASMVFDKGPRGFFTMMGVSPEKAVRELQKSGADIIGSNCGNGIENMLELARKLRALTDRYLIIHSNAGIPKIVDSEIVYTETPKWMAKYFQLMAEIKINIIGGCCGTNPEHIRELSRILRGEKDNGKIPCHLSH